MFTRNTSGKIPSQSLSDDVQLFQSRPSPIIPIIRLSIFVTIATSVTAAKLLAVLVICGVIGQVDASRFPSIEHNPLQIPKVIVSVS
jgi:hypothetical protein